MQHGKHIVHNRIANAHKRFVRTAAYMQGANKVGQLQQRIFHAVYFGGGTPTALEAEDLKRILEGVREALPLANDCEITVEGRLTNFGSRKMEACLEGGANRFSLGVQSFHTSIRQSMGRLGSREDMERGLEQLLSYDQAAVIVDLIYGFPNQTLELWREDIAVAQSLNLDGADCYQLNVYRQTPLGRGIEQGKIAPTADIPLQSAMLPLCPARLPKAAGMPMRHNLGRAALFHRQLAKDDRLMIPRRTARAILQAKPSTDEATVDHATPA